MTTSGPVKAGLNLDKQEQAGDVQHYLERRKAERERARTRPRGVIGEPQYLRDEKIAVRQSRVERLGAVEAEKMPLAGLGISGGGIRSASLSLGVLQAFAEKDLLKYFDYISSVSGGGYLAGALQWWWHKGARADGTQNQQTKFGFGPNDFPYGPARIATQEEGDTKKRGRENLSFLRSHSAYLIPGNGLTTQSMAIVLMRTILISLFIWIPVLAGAFRLIHYIDYNYLEEYARSWGLWSPLGDLMSSQWRGDPVSVSDSAFYFRVVYASVGWAFIGSTVFFWIAAVVFAYLSRAPQSDSGRRNVTALVAVIIASIGFLLYAWLSFRPFDASITIAAFMLVVVMAICTTLIIAEYRTDSSLNSSYWLRRKLEIVLGQLLLPSLACLAFALVPVVPYAISGNLASGKFTLATLVGLISGIGSAVYGYYTFIRSLVPSLASQVAATVGAGVYIYFTLALAYCLALASDDGIGSWSYLSYLLNGLLLLALFLGFYANINYVGLHRFYRDRLMEAFMPTDRAVSNDKSEPSPVADNFLVSSLATADGKLQAFPYPLINTNVILINDDNKTYANRGGDNFVISPLFVGSSATEWQRTKTYVEEKSPLTLASAVAASGAAATASAGSLGTGITRNPLVAATMSLLNVRLGLWMPNPRRAALGFFNPIPSFFYPGLLSGLLASRHTSDSRFIELTDGGHFENLGLYELVRRRLPIIVIIDGEADPTISLSSLVSAVRRTEQDFKVTITFVEGRGPESLMMYDEKGYPAGLRYAAEPFMIGKIRYGHNKFGTLIYLKSTLIKKLDFTVAGYLAGNPTFPHQSTVDQFFDPDQSDAYRYLGYDAAMLMIKTLDLTNTIRTPGELLKPPSTTALKAGNSIKAHFQTGSTFGAPPAFHAPSNADPK